MAFRVELTKSAEADLEALYLWVKGRAPHQGAAWFSGLEPAILSLGQPLHGVQSRLRVPTRNVRCAYSFMGAPDRCIGCSSGSMAQTAPCMCSTFAAEPARLDACRSLVRSPSNQSPVALRWLDYRRYRSWRSLVRLLGFWLAT